MKRLCRRPRRRAAHQAQPTPASLGWVKGPDAVAAAESKPGPAAKAAPVVAHPKEETHIARSESVSHEPVSHEGWVIQIGASDNPDKANDLLIRAKAANRSTLASAKPFTEKVANGDSTFYRARFAGLDLACRRSRLPFAEAQRLLLLPDARLAKSKQSLDDE